MKVALVHDWLLSYRGGEKVLEKICELFPEAPIYTLFYSPKELPSSLNSRDIRYPKALQKFQKFRKLLLPLFPALVESLPLYEFDLIISTSSCVAKGIIPSPEAKHISYIHSPMRYIWDQQQEYFQNIKNFPGIKSIIKMLSTHLRTWDYVSSQRIDVIIANSNFVAKRIHRYYGKDSHIIHPPINTEFFQAIAKQKNIDNDYFLMAGAFVSYKRFDLAINACEKMQKKLIVAGSGPLEQNLRKIAGKYTEFIIRPDDKELRSLLQNAQALIFPGVEDFGMTALEAMACATPVIALQKGGSLDFIKPHKTGIFFQEQNVNSLCESLKIFERTKFDPQELRNFALRFSYEEFHQNFLKVLKPYLAKEINSES